jgi:hypothetical protein
MMLQSSSSISRFSDAGGYGPVTVQALGLLRGTKSEPAQVPPLGPALSGRVQLSALTLVYHRTKVLAVTIRLQMDGPAWF